MKDSLNPHKSVSFQCMEEKRNEILIHPAPFISFIDHDIGDNVSKKIKN